MEMKRHRDDGLQARVIATLGHRHAPDIHLCTEHSEMHPCSGERCESDPNRCERSIIVRYANIRPVIKIYRRAATLTHLRSVSHRLTVTISMVSINAM